MKKSQPLACPSPFAIKNQKSKFKNGHPRFNVLTFLTLLTLPITGCQVLSYTGPSGERFTRSSFGANTTLSSLRVEADTNGLRRVELKGYQNDSTRALGIVTESAVKAALQSVK